MVLLILLFYMVFTVAAVEKDLRARTLQQRRCNVPKFIDPAWSSFHPFYPLRISEPQGLLVGTDIVIFSGFTNAFTAASTSSFARNVVNVNNSTWFEIRFMPFETGMTHMATVKVGSIVYLCGGYSGAHPGRHSPNCLRYNHLAPSSIRWSFLPDLPHGGTGGGGMIYSTKHKTIYYVGGGQRSQSGRPESTDVTTTWKLALNNTRAGWRRSTPIPYAANHISYVTHRDINGIERHFMLGGQTSENEHAGNLNFHFEFIPDNETWIQRAPIPFPRGHSASSTRMIGCGFIIAGGSINNPDKTSRKRISTDDVSYYDIYANKWTASIGKLPGKGNTPIVDIHSNGYMYFVNGRISDRRRISA